MIIETIQEDMRSLVSLSGRECAMRYVTWRTGVLLRGAGETNSEYFAVVKPGQKQREPGFPYKVSFYGLTTAGELQQGIATGISCTGRSQRDLALAKETLLLAKRFCSWQRDFALGKENLLLAKKLCS